MSQDEEVSCDKSEIPRSNSVVLFRLGISKIFKNIATSVSDEEFTELLTVIKEKPSVGRKLHKAMIDELFNRMNDELEEIVQEGSLENGLIELHKLTQEKNNVNNEIAWRPPGDVKLHVRSFDAEKIKTETEKLEELVTGLEQKNDTLMKKIADSRTQINAMSERMARNLCRAPMIQEHLENQVKQLQRLLEALEED